MPRDTKKMVFLMSLILTFAIIGVTPFHERAYFHHRGKLVFISSYHQVVVEVHLGDLISELNEMKIYLEKIKIEAENASDEPLSDSRPIWLAKAMHKYLREMKSTIVDLERGEEAMYNLTNFMPGTESNRLEKLTEELETPSAYPLNILTKDEIIATNEQVDKIITETNLVVTEVNHHATLLYEPSEVVTSAKTFMKEIKNILREIFNQKTISELMNNLWIRELLDGLKENVNSIDSGIRNMNEGSISTDIISLRGVEIILERLRAKGNMLLFEKFEHLDLYTDFRLVIPVQSGDSKDLRYIILLPLQDMTYKFHLFEINPFLQWNATLGLGFAYEPEAKYLAVSDNPKAYSTLKTLENCKTTIESYVCPADRPIFLSEEGICEIDLYFQNTGPIESCTKMVYSDEQPKFIFTKEGYIYSVPSPISVIVMCAKHLTRVEEKTLIGTGILVLRNGCFAKVQNTRILLNFAPGGINMGEKSIDIRQFLNISHVFLTDDEYKLLEVEKKAIRQKLNSKSTKSLELKKLIHWLKQVKAIRHSPVLSITDMICYILIALTISIFLALTFLKVFRKRYDITQCCLKYHRMSSSNSSRTSLTKRSVFAFKKFDTRKINNNFYKDKRRDIRNLSVPLTNGNTFSKYK